jgi:hypothetical protein
MRSTKISLLKKLKKRIAAIVTVNYKPMPKSKSPASGKVNVPKWGVISSDGSYLYSTFHNREQAEPQKEYLANVFHLETKIVRLTGIVSYQIAK